MLIVHTVYQRILFGAFLLTISTVVGTEAAYRWGAALGIAISVILIALGLWLGIRGLLETRKRREARIIGQILIAVILGNWIGIATCYFLFDRGSQPWSSFCLLGLIWTERWVDDQMRRKPAY